MKMTRINSPEILYGDTMSKVVAYEALSHRYALAGNSFVAIHAAFAADVNTTQALMWERVMLASPQPDEQFFAIATTVSRSLAVWAKRGNAPVDAHAAVCSARDGLSAAFDESALTLLKENFISLDHLVGLKAPDANAGTLLASARLGNMTSAELSEKRQQTAIDCMTVAKGYTAGGLDEDAMQQAWQSDWAAYEGYLLDAAVAVGDNSLVTVEMRWTLACDAVATISELPADLISALKMTRAQIVAALGPIEGARMQNRFLPASS